MGDVWVTATILAINEAEQTESQKPPPAARVNYLAIGLPLALFGLTLATFAGARQRNLALIHAHQALFTARTTGELPASQAETAVTLLTRAIQRDPQNAQLFGAIGSLYAWPGNNAAALEALRQRAALDGADPLSHYIIFESFRYQLQSKVIPDSDDSLKRTYRQWLNRFPNRAETYVLAAPAEIQTTSSSDRAIAVLQSGRVYFTFGAKGGK